MELTNGRGVDVVLNALAAEAIPMGLSCLAESGRFIEIGKRDIYQELPHPALVAAAQCLVPRGRDGRGVRRRRGADPRI